MLTRPNLATVRNWTCAQSVSNFLVTYSYDALRFLLAVVLLSAAAFKGLDVANGALVGGSFWDSRPFLIPLVLVELVFALWLLFGLCPQVTRWVAILLFVAFLEFSLIQGLNGQKTCRCLGRFEISPWIMFAFDALVVWCLLVTRPNSAADIGFTRWRLFGFIAMSLLIGVPALLNMVFATPRGPMLDLRREQKLVVPVALDLKSPSTEDILQRLRKTTGLSLTIDERLSHTPNYGRIGPTKLKVFSAMELIAAKQPVETRWDKSEDGYHLRSATPWGHRLTPWAISASAGGALLLSVGLWFVRRHPTNEIEGRTTADTKTTAHTPPGSTHD